VSLRPLRERFTRPDGFDLAAFWKAHVERYEQADTDEVATVRLTPNGVSALPDVLGPKAARLALRTLTPADPDGWHEATIPLENVPHAVATLLRLAADVQVLAPAQLVARMTKTIHAMTRLYPT
jgi:predicted DNA-binding transcriptional regulator YafY